MHCCVRNHKGITSNEREDNIKVHMNVLIGFNWLRIGKGGLRYALMFEKP